MFRSLKLGTAFGIGIFLHWTFFLLPLVLFLVNLGGKDGGVGPALFIVAMLFSIFACVVLHELGHALMARVFGIKTLDITLYPIGGVARLGGTGRGGAAMSEEPFQELCIALAGPAVNVVLAIIFGGLLWATTAPTDWARWAQPSVRHPFLLDLLLSNVLLVLFNIIPAFPMDGGRVLRALLSFPLGHVIATEIAAGLGALLALGFMLLGVLNVGPPMLLVIGAFVFFAGRQELMAVRYREAARRAHTVQRTFSAAWNSPSFTSATDPSTASIDPSFSGFIWDADEHSWVLWRHGRPVRVYHHFPE